MMFNSLLQFSLIFDYLPAWLSIVLVSVGVIIAMSTIVSAGTDDVWVTRIVLAGVALGSFLFMYGLRYLDPRPMMIGIILIAKYIEGLTVLRLYQKLVYVYRKRSLPSSAATVSGYGKKIYYFVIIIFVLIVAFWVAIFAVVWGPVETTFATSLRLYWTFATVILSAFGLWVKLRGTDETGLPSGIKTGGILVIVGAEIYNFQTFQLNLVLYFAGLLAYSIGYWIAFSRFVTAFRGSTQSSGGKTAELLTEITNEAGVFKRLPLGFILGMVAVSLAVSVVTFYVIITTTVCNPPTIATSICQVLP